MSFAVYMVAFLVFMAGVVWAAVVVGVPQQYIAIGAALLIGAGVVAAAVIGRRDPRQRHR
jgi:positive regulator of sigma E activity